MKKLKTINPVMEEIRDLLKTKRLTLIMKEEKMRLQILVDFHVLCSLMN